MMSAETSSTTNNDRLSAEDNQRLSDALQHLHSQLSPLNAPPALETKLLRAFDRQHRAAGWSRNVGEWLAPGTAIAASLVFSVWMLLGTTPTALVNPIQQPFADSKSVGPFIALQSIEQILLEPNPHVIETQLPKMMLASLGVPVSPDVVGENVRAEMLVSAAGQPLAIRLSY